MYKIQRDINFGISFLQSVLRSETEGLGRKLSRIMGITSDLRTHLFHNHSLSLLVQSTRTVHPRSRTALALWACINANIFRKLSSSLVHRTVVCVSLSSYTWICGYSQICKARKLDLICQCAGMHLIKYSSKARKLVYGKYRGTETHPSSFLQMSMFFLHGYRWNPLGIW